GVLPAKQLADEPLPAIGDRLEVTVTGFDEDEGLLLLSRKDAVMAAAWETLQVGQNVEGVVTGHNKGGLEIKIDGIDAFIPISQIDRSRIESEDLPAYTNKRLRCRVIEFHRGEQKLVVSRREVMDEEAAAAREELFETLVEGQTVTGTVRTIMPYGAFVDIGGVDGLLPVRDMGYSRIEDPATVVAEGQQLELKVLKVDREEKKIALGLKQIQADPWADAEEKWPVDSIVSGRVTRLMDFGAFVELAEGVEGLIPIGEMTFERRISHPREIVNENEVVKVRVLTVDTQRNRISLSLKRVGDDPWMGASLRWPELTAVEGTVKRITDFGAFVELTPGVEGLVHISELADGRVHKVGDVVKEGDVIQAKVLSVDEDRRRIALSIKQVATMPDYTGAPSAEPEPSPQQPKRKKPLKGGLDR
ncbi:MAG: S1 RNA-binding domain-containing protein, partial [Planctomycetes bacterium]|nr:S1 RNA-binding domain-containing protein [Planctomycetota bacterium]